MLPKFTSSVGMIRLFTIVFALLVLLSDSTADSSTIRFHRITRNFPYSLAYMRMLRPAPAAVQSAPYQWPTRVDTNEELMELIDQLDNKQIMSRSRRALEGAVYKRYACRFKFCRIFDA
ncbi:hypothetical protein M3Y98_01133000 [Aphelenchoides besseyi]|nr:hypothetical protein M3Y98_01133000 [Aphelenchoides besseyi]KAI6210607.1 hypothetical protein M3Y96_00346000 [Aphelenchoides besseyi]